MKRLTPEEAVAELERVPEWLSESISQAQWSRVCDALALAKTALAQPEPRQEYEERAPAPDWQAILRAGDAMLSAHLADLCADEAICGLVRNWRVSTAGLDRGKP